MGLNLLLISLGGIIEKMTQGGDGMDTLRQHFLNILKNALVGQPLKEMPVLAMEQWEHMAQLAAHHKLTPLFYDTIRGLPQLEGTEFLACLRMSSRQQIVLQTQKSYEFLKLYGALLHAGVTPLVVKGIVCRSLYPQPDHRPSSDEDLLIEPHQFRLCHEVFGRCGLHTEVTSDRLESDYEIPYHSKNGPLFVELHRSLFPPESEAYGQMNDFFTDAFLNATQVMVDGVAVATLAPTDHLFYLIVHALKHFLHSGFGIRQICDIVLYANTYGEQVDWGKLLEQCVTIRAEYFAAAIFRIGRNYLVFDAEKAGYPACWADLPVEEENLLQDVLDGGVYGSASKSRQHSSNITLEAAAAGKQERKTGKPLLGTLFPPVRRLKGRYPWLEKKPWLLPVAWVDRIVRYGLETRRTSGNTAEEALKIGYERIELLKQYGIIR